MAPGKSTMSIVDKIYSVSLEQVAWSSALLTGVSHDPTDFVDSKETDI